MTNRIPAAAVTQPNPCRTDWLVDPSPYKARILMEGQKIVLENGLARRVFRQGTTVDLVNLSSGEHLLRALSPEGRVTLNGTEYPIGGLTGQKILNYFKAEWLDTFVPSPGGYGFSQWKEAPVVERLAWKKRPEWLARDVAWPPPGKHLVLCFQPPAASVELPAVEVHYELYDGLPVFSKWLEIKSSSPLPVRINRFVAEELRLAEVESGVDNPPVNEPPNLWVETDFAFRGMEVPGANKAVFLEPDPDYKTQVNFKLQTPCLLKCQPPQMGPDVDLDTGETFKTFYTFELLLDSTERERRTLARRRMYRALAPWTNQNPLMFHKIQADPQTVREAIDQAAAVGFELVIMSFASGFNFESRDRKYWDLYKELADYGRSKGVALGGYSLLASRGADEASSNTQGQPVTFGLMPCLGSRWGREYLDNIIAFAKYAGLGAFENDGSYPGDRCAATDHPFHHGLEDSQWVMWRAITAHYKALQAEGIFLNVPDWYLLSGSNKTGMGYRETNWSLPRAEQELIERQNMYDGTWGKTQSMGWMFVPLSQYHGGGPETTLEPLKDHLPHYEARLCNLLGYGVQACWRGPKLFDTPETKALVTKWVKYYKDHREVLDGGDIIHLRRANGLDWDGILHVNPQGLEQGLAFLWNPLGEPIEREIRLPLYYTGLTDSAQLSVNDGVFERVLLDATQTVTLKVLIPAQGHLRLLFMAL